MLTPSQLQSVQTKIKHVIVLMLENRSFDHMLGYSGIQGTIARTGNRGTIEGIDPANPPSNSDNSNQPVFSSPDAPFVMDPPDPGHDLKDVLVQLTGRTDTKLDPNGNYPAPLNNSGFVKS
ncbi:MAG TPA: alkaline phosphatase family protein, partial [Puia sp.]|nr:alkaline phosphatase family protein [Puia sp.]